MKTEAEILAEIGSVDASLTLFDQERHAYAAPYWTFLLRGLLEGDIESIRAESQHLRRTQAPLKRLQGRIEALLDWRAQPMPQRVTLNALAIMRFAHLEYIGDSPSDVRSGFSRMRDDVFRFLIHRDGERCVRCGTIHNLEVDHIMPVAHGGGNYLMNFQLLCYDCNRWKREFVWKPGMPRRYSVKEIR